LPRSGWTLRFLEELDDGANLLLIHLIVTVKIEQSVDRCFHRKDSGGCLPLLGDNIPCAPSSDNLDLLYPAVSVEVDPVVLVPVEIVVDRVPSRPFSLTST
jgi:hypothetical protein